MVKKNMVTMRNRMNWPMLVTLKNKSIRLEAKQEIDIEKTHKNSEHLVQLIESGYIELVSKVDSKSRKKTSKPKAKEKKTSKSTKNKKKKVGGG